MPPDSHEISESDGTSDFTSEWYQGSCQGDAYAFPETHELIQQLRQDLIINSLKTKNVFADTPLCSVTEGFALMAPVQPNEASEPHILAIGTDCSGMEAPLQALNNMNIRYSHIFSCENDPQAIKTILGNFLPFLRVVAIR